MNWSELGQLGASLSTAARGEKDHLDRSLPEAAFAFATTAARCVFATELCTSIRVRSGRACRCEPMTAGAAGPHLPIGELRSEEHTSELQSRSDLVCRLLLEKKKKT